MNRFKEPEDILRRAARPQRHSTYVPSARDWRWATGIYQEADFEDSREDMTIWDRLDGDNSLSLRARPRLLAQGSEMRELNNGTTSSEAGRVVESPVKPSRPFQVCQFILDPKEIKELESQWKQVGLTVCLKFGKEKADTVKDILEASPGPFPLAAIDVPEQIDIGALTLSESQPELTAELVPQLNWKDDTIAFKWTDVGGKLRSPTILLIPFPAGELFNWFPDATPADVIFPPGVPITAKEILAFYPHHIRWHDVYLRLRRNKFMTGALYLIECSLRGIQPDRSLAYRLTNVIRDIPRQVESKTGIDVKALLGTPCLDLHTLGMEGTKAVNDRDYITPTYKSLVAGLKFLPTGPDARELTNCITWYLQHRDLFTPQLELNVLHTQSLIRALRQPLEPVGDRNMDALGSEEWTKNKKLSVIRLEDIEIATKMPTTEQESQSKNSRLTVSAATGKVGVDVNIRLCHILLFPFLKIMGVTGEYWKVGIEKLEKRRVEELESEESDNEGLESEEPEHGDDVPEDSTSSGSRKRKHLLTEEDFRKKFKSS